MKKISSNKKRFSVLIFPVILTLFFFTLVIFGSFTKPKLLSGNSTTTNLVCPDSYNLMNKKCIKRVNATKLGDVNGDNIVNVVDVNIIQSYLNNNYLLVDQSLNAADINKDKKVDQDDVDLLNTSVTQDKEISGYVCSNEDTKNKNMCVKKIKPYKLKQDNDYTKGDIITYNYTYWYILNVSQKTLTLIKLNPLTAKELGNYVIVDNKINYNLDNIKTILDGYASDFANDLEEVDGSKIRLLSINDLTELGYSDTSGTSYYEQGVSSPYFLNANNKDVFVINGDEKFFMTSYNGANYVYKNDTTIAQVVPVINLKKEALNND